MRNRLEFQRLRPLLRRRRSLLMVLLPFGLTVIPNPLAAGQEGQARSPAQAALMWTVNSTGDAQHKERDPQRRGQVCDTGNLLPDGRIECTLRAAIETHDPNRIGGQNRIEFDVGTGTPTIRVGSLGFGPLPLIRGSLVIVGDTGGADRVELDGAMAGPNANGLWIVGGQCVVRRMVINRFSLNGMLIGGTPPPGEGSHRIEGNLIGTDKDAETALPNGGDGIRLESRNTIIGGTDEGARNVVSGNGTNGIRIASTMFGMATGNRVEGNLIGLKANGADPLPNGRDGVAIIAATANTIGGAATGARNIISGNSSAGVRISAARQANLVQGNFIGTDSAGAAAAGNQDGVRIEEGARNQEIRDNLISGNSNRGVLIIGQGTEENKVYLNKIGTDAAGTARLGNGFDGVEISDEASKNDIGAPDLGNVISANTRNGVHISAGGTRENRVRSNFIGTNDTGADLGNQLSGVLMDQSAGPNQIGTFKDFGVNPECGLTPDQEREGNVIGRNSEAGVAIVDSVPENNANQVDGNYIGVTRDNRLIGNLGDGVLIFSSARSTVDENVIGNNGQRFAGGAGLFISGSSDNEARCNFIGTDRLRELNAGNTPDGVRLDGPEFLAADNRIGSFGPNFGPIGNFIRHNNVGILVLPDAASNFIIKNDIALNGTGIVVSAPLPAGRVNTTTIGGIRRELGNTIHQNGVGVVIAGPGASSNSLESNEIINNQGIGIRIETGANSNHIGGFADRENLIRNNEGTGIVIVGPNSDGNSLGRNSINQNAGLGIDLGDDGVTENDDQDPDAGPNEEMNFPEILQATSDGEATTIGGRFNSLPNTDFDLRFYASPACDPSGNGEGETFVGGVRVGTDAMGNRVFLEVFPTPVPVGHVITATATDRDGNTSEFSDCKQVTQGARGPL